MLSNAFILITGGAVPLNCTEYNPFEDVKTNVIGAMNFIDSWFDQNHKKLEGFYHHDPLRTPRH
jgi:hypothetical protein